MNALHISHRDLLRLAVLIGAATRRNKPRTRGMLHANAAPRRFAHRFRDSFAVDLLSRGASPYDVAKLLGDTVDTVEKHYAPFVRELWERARRIMETGEGLEITDTQWTQEKAIERKIH